MSTGFPFDQVGGSASSSRALVSGESSAKRAAEIDQAIDGEHAQSAAIRQHGEALSGKRLQPAERLGRIEQLFEIEDAEQAGTVERGVIDRVGAGERAGMGRGSLRALRAPSRLDDDHRLGARRRTRRRHELARILDRTRCKA